MKRSVYLAYVQKAYDEGRMGPSAYDAALLNAENFSDDDDDEDDGVDSDINVETQELMHKIVEENNSKNVLKSLSDLPREFDNFRILKKHFYSAAKDGSEVLVDRVDAIFNLYGDTLHTALINDGKEDIINHYSLFDLTEMVPVATDYNYPYGVYRYTRNGKYYYFSEDGLTRVVPNIILENQKISESFFCDENGEYVDREKLFDRYDSFCCSMADDTSCYIYFEEDDWNDEEKADFQKLLKTMPKYHPFERAELCEVYCYDNLPTYVTCPAYDAFTIPVFDKETNIFSYNHHDMEAETMDNVCVHLLDMFYENNRTEEEYYNICEVCKIMNVPLQNIIDAYEQSENME